MIDNIIGIDIIRYFLVYALLKCAVGKRKLKLDKIAAISNPHVFKILITPN